MFEIRADKEAKNRSSQQQYTNKQNKNKETEQRGKTLLVSLFYYLTYFPHFPRHSPRILPCSPGISLCEWDNDDMVMIMPLLPQFMPVWMCVPCFLCNDFLPLCIFFCMLQQRGKSGVVKILSFKRKYFTAAFPLLLLYLLSTKKISFISLSLLSQRGFHFYHHYFFLPRKIIYSQNCFIYVCIISSYTWNSPRKERNKGKRGLLKDEEVKDEDYDDDALLSHHEWWKTTVFNTNQLQTHKKSVFTAEEKTAKYFPYICWMDTHISLYMHMTRLL